MYIKLFVSLRALGMCGRSTFLRAWFPGVRKFVLESQLRAGILSAVRKQEASASRRLRMYMYYNHAKSNP